MYLQIARVPQTENDARCNGMADGSVSKHISGSESGWVAGFESSGSLAELQVCACHSVGCGSQTEASSSEEESSGA